ncbi:MAG TPA: phosphatidate cytidylyltransferase [Candidatus Angelobacter sp.]|nr:phosphatidate cytidylyltransferase [Candidatus Angelobacter sp.]
MKRVLTAVALVPVVLLLLFKAPWPVFVLAIATVIILTLREYLDVTEAYGMKPFRGLTYLVSILVVLAFTAYNYRWTSWMLSEGFLSLIALSYLLAVVFGVPVVLRKEMRMAVPAAAMSLLGILYIAVSLGLLIRFRHLPRNEYLIVFILFSVWGGDIAAYYVGKNFGRHKLAPVVSPNKSWEGAIASVIASIGIALLVFHWRETLNAFFTHEPNTSILVPSPLGLPQIIVLGLITNIAAQLGDLFESALKRGAGVKDSGTILPGHGGVLDRIDALLFAIPVVWYYAELTGQFNTQVINLFP